MLSTQAMTAIATTLFLAVAQTHMILNTPVPFDKPNINNSPLENDASNWPCKFGTLETGGNYGAIVTTMNMMTVGEPQTLSFIGGATHSGGSCQVSLTTDTAPTKNSQWKVIYSIISGCPSNFTGNLSGDPDGTNAATFTYAIPRGIPSGKYSLAWTWFNKSGNREMYMNCAPVTITGAGSRRKRSDAMPAAWTSLPEMFVANIPNEQCSTIEDYDYVFPPAFQSGAPATTPFKTQLGSSLSGSGCSSMNKLGNSNGQAAVAFSTSAPAAGSSMAAAPSVPTMAASSAAAAPTSASEAVPVVMPTSAAPMASASAAPAPVMSSAAASAPMASSAPAAASSAAPASGSGSCPSGQVPCTAATLICVGSNQFALCDRGCGIPQQLAAGTSCAGGTITKRDIQAPSNWRKVLGTLLH